MYCLEACNADMTLHATLHMYSSDADLLHAAGHVQKQPGDEHVHKQPGDVQEHMHYVFAERMCVRSSLIMKTLSLP